MEHSLRPFKITLTVLFVLIASTSLWADSQPSSDISAKAFEGAVSLTQTLTQWAFLIFGGSIALLVGSSHRRPRGRIKFAYFLFVPGWILLGISLFWGRSVQGVYLAFLFQVNQNMAQLKQAANHDAYCQMLFLEMGLGCFALWLLIYILWWVLTDFEQDKNK
jgi:hypothetical protein